LGHIFGRFFSQNHLVTLSQDDLVCKAIKESQIFDATQVKLPYNYVVPYIGWNSVNDKMSSRDRFYKTLFRPKKF
jgi:imidazoleglycerol phosphate synthase glutamine amidotransferase subunit HisH